MFWIAADRAATILVILSTGLLVWMAGTGRIAIRGVTQAASPPVLEDIEDQKLLTSVRAGARQGSPSAKVVLIEFGDYECPYCGQHAREVYPEIVREYVQSGRVQYVFQHAPIERHPQSLTAAETAECARSQGKYWEAVHARLFNMQGGLSGPAADEFAEAAGLELSAFRACRETGEATETVRGDQAEAHALGVRGTPTFFVGLAGDDGSVRLLKRFSGALPYSFFESALEDVLAIEPALGNS